MIFAAHARPISTPASGTERRTATSAATASATASASRCPALTPTNSSSGLSSHSTATRVRARFAAAMPPVRSARPAAACCSSSPVATNASAPISVNTKTAVCGDGPATFAANHCSAVATGPYTDGVSCHGASTAIPTGSPLSARSCAVSRYGFRPVAASRPYAAYTRWSADPIGGTSTAATAAPVPTIVRRRGSGAQPRRSASIARPSPAAPTSADPRSNPVTTAADGSAPRW